MRKVYKTTKYIWQQKSSTSHVLVHFPTGIRRMHEAYTTVGTMTSLPRNRIFTKVDMTRIRTTNLSTN